MSKPKYIPQDVMNHAHMVWQNANTEGSVFTADGQSSKYIPAIAHAILAAEQREREACAALCDAARQKCLKDRDEAVHGTPMRILSNGAQALADYLAGAIRNRGNVSTAHKSENQEA